MFVSRLILGLPQCELLTVLFLPKSYSHLCLVNKALQRLQSSGSNILLDQAPVASTGDSLGLWSHR